MIWNKPRMTLLLIAGLFLAPIVAAVLMQSRWWHYEPAHTTNLGILVTPAVPMDRSGLVALGTPRNSEGAGPRWTVIFPVTPDCANACRKTVAGLRQVHKAAGRHQGELRIMLVLPEGFAGDLAADLAKILPSFELAGDPQARLLRQLAQITGEEPAQLPEPGQAFLADPGGNIMMRYPVGFKLADLNKDLKHVLNWSAQGN